jgi:hypothetical protein
MSAIAASWNASPKDRKKKPRACTHREDGERLHRRDASAHEEGEHRLHRERDHRGQCEREVERRDIAVANLRVLGPVERAGDELLDGGGRHEAGGHRFRDHAGGEGHAPDPRTGHVEEQIAREAGAGHRREPDHRSIRHQARLS